MDENKICIMKLLDNLRFEFYYQKENYELCYSLLQPLRIYQKLWSLKRLNVVLNYTETLFKSYF